MADVAAALAGVHAAALELAAATKPGRLASLDAIHAAMLRSNRAQQALLAELGAVKAPDEPS